MEGPKDQPPYLEENLWGYGKRLQFVDRAVRQAFPDVPRRRLTLLDVGCGNGSQLAVPLAEAGYRVLGVDPHRASIERGRALGSAVHFVHGTLGDLPAAEADCVILSEVLEHLLEPERLVEEALPFLTSEGLLIVTVPNGYGEFELDRRLYQAFRLDRLMARVHASFQKDKGQGQIAGSDCESPHVQRFTLSALRDLFTRLDLEILNARATSLASGPFIAHSLGHSRTFTLWNAAITDRLPMRVASGWMFALRRRPRSG